MDVNTILVEQSIVTKCVEIGRPTPTTFESFAGTMKVSESAANEVSGVNGEDNGSKIVHVFER